MTQIAFPYRVNGRGRSARSDANAHIHSLIEQVLFVSPGERINNPAFGSGLLGLTFAAANDAMAGASQMIVQAALQQWLGDLIQVQQVEVQTEDNRVVVSVCYVVNRTRQQEVATFSRST